MNLGIFPYRNVIPQASDGFWHAVTFQEVFDTAHRSHPIGSQTAGKLEVEIGRRWRNFQACRVEVEATSCGLYPSYNSYTVSE